MFPNLPFPAERLFSGRVQDAGFDYGNFGSQFLGVQADLQVVFAVQMGLTDAQLPFGLGLQFGGEGFGGEFLACAQHAKLLFEIGNLPGENELSQALGLSRVFEILFRYFFGNPGESPVLELLAHLSVECRLWSKDPVCEVEDGASWTVGMISIAKVSCKKILNTCNPTFILLMVNQMLENK